MDDKKKQTADILDKLDETLNKIGEERAKVEIKENKKSIKERFLELFLEEIRSPVEILSEVTKITTILGKISECISKFRVDIPKKFNVEVDNEVKVSNLDEIVIPKIEIPKVIDIKKPIWWQPLDLSKILEAIRELKNIKFPEFPKAVEVSNLRDLQITVASGGGGSVPKIRLGGNEYGLTTSGLSLPKFDYVSLSINSATETYTFKEGGASGNTVATVVIVYTDATRADISTVTKT